MLSSCGVCRLWCVLWIVGEKKKCQHSALWHPDGTTHQCIIPILHIISIKHQLRILNQFHPHHSWESWAVKIWRKPWSCFPASSTHSPARISLACQTNISVSTFQSKRGESKNTSSCNSLLKTFKLFQSKRKNTSRCNSLLKTPSPAFQSALCWMLSCTCNKQSNPIYFHHLHCSFCFCNQLKFDMWDTSPPYKVREKTDNQGSWGM